MTSRTYSSESRRRAGDDLRQPAQDVDVGVGVAELDLLQIARAEGLFLGRLGNVERHVHPFVGQRERGLADDEMFARLQVETGGRLAADEDRIAGRSQPIDAQPRAVPTDLGMIAAHAVVPGGRPAGRAAAQHDRPAGEQRSPPAVLRIDSLGDQIGHVERQKLLGCLRAGREVNRPGRSPISVRSLDQRTRITKPHTAVRNRRDQRHRQQPVAPGGAAQIVQRAADGPVVRFLHDHHPAGVARANADVARDASQRLR